MRAQILVASGDDSIRRLISTCLAHEGFAIVEARTGEAALALLSRADSDIALAILDGQFPPISGTQIVRTLRQLAIPVPVILASGSFVFDGLPPDDLLAYLSKPFDVKDLGILVRGMLHRRENVPPAYTEG